MLERSKRPLGDEERQVLERYRQNAIGTTQFEAKYAFFGGVAGLALGILWIALFHAGDRSAPLWPILALTAAGAAVGFPFDHVRNRKQRQEREAAAAAEWDPIIAVGVVERLVAEASKAVRLDDNEANTAWFLQVGDKRILCVWDWADDATERVEVDWVPGIHPTPLKISWTGDKLIPLRPKRRFKRGERQPEQCELLDGTLEELDVLLRKERTTKPATRANAKAKTAVSPSSKLADDVESLGFYKYAAADQIAELKAEIEEGAHEWYLAAGRAFGADAERLAEGGVKDLIDYMRPALEVEGREVPTDIEETYDTERGYTIRIGAERITLWGEGEGNKAWELTTTRTSALLNEWLSKAGSEERVHILYGGEDAIFVFLTAAMRKAITDSGVFKAADIPAPA